MFGWTLGVWDTDRPGAEIIRQRVRAGIGPGTILLLHDGDGYDPLGDRSQTAEALRRHHRRHPRGRLLPRPALRPRSRVRGR